LKSGKYRSFGSLDDTLDDNELDEEESNTRFHSTDQSDLFDPHLFSQTQSEAPTLDNTLNDDENNVDDAPLKEYTAQKRHRQSATIEDNSSKRLRPSGVGVMKEISEGMKVIAEAVKENSSNIEQVPKDTVDSTIVGQAQLRILEETSLTEEGQLLMIEMLADVKG
jgi:hypothetical protein